jgi:hypothetical protein
MATPEPCPASLPLCWCGVRGCLIAEHRPVRRRLFRLRKH